MSRASDLVKRLKEATEARLRGQPVQLNRAMRRAILRPWRRHRRSDRWGRVTTATFTGHRRPASYTKRVYRGAE